MNLLRLPADGQDPGCGTNDARLSGTLNAPFWLGNYGDNFAVVKPSVYDLHTEP
jgi:hypothetical protein